MIVAFLIGNGFDINWGLDTSYPNFYGWYVNQESRTQPITQFKESIKIIVIKLWVDLEYLFKRYLKKTDVQFWHFVE